jgi:predicted RNA methylase
VTTPYSDPAALAKLGATLGHLEQRPALLHAEGCVERAEALDFIDFHFTHGLAEAGPETVETLALLDRAERLRRALEQADRAFTSELRERLRTGDCSGGELSELLGRFHERSTGPTGATYDFSDGFVNAVLGFDETTFRPQVELTPEMVFFQATPVRCVLELVTRAGITDADVFFDLGCGTGKVLMLVALLTGAAAVGVELEPAYCDFARARVEALGLRRVQLRNEDARRADYSSGTVFFMFHPFTGALLEAVLQRLRAQTEGRSIRLCTLGRCTFAVAQEEWLERVSPEAPSEFELAVFRRPTNTNT